MKEPIIHRLMRELEGGYKVVGYEKHTLPLFGKMSSLRIYHSKDGETNWEDIMSYEYGFIPHDRRDRWTGVTLNDEAKLFERDEVEVTDEMDEIGSTDTGHGKIEYLSEKALWYIDGDINNSLTDIVDSCCFARYIKIVGIEGVHKTEEE